MNPTQKRFVLIDANHLAHRYNNGMVNRLSFKVNGVRRDTTIANGMIKSIWRYSGMGVYPTAVCMDSPGRSRKELFRNMFPTETKSKDGGYKGDRVPAGGSLYEGLDMVKGVLNGAVTMIQGFDYEADDLIMACINTIRGKFGTESVKIDVVTNDSDLLPLVDEQVSVFYRSMQGTYAESPELVKTKYIQFTPRNFEEQVNRLSAYKVDNNKYIGVPYNCLLLNKILRGDESDNIPGDKRAFPPRRLDEMYRAAVERGISIRFNQWEFVRDFIKGFLTEEEYEKYMPRIWARYTLSDLNNNICLLENGRTKIIRYPTRVVMPSKINEGVLRRNASVLGINLPM